MATQIERTDEQTTTRVERGYSRPAVRAHARRWIPSRRVDDIARTTAAAQTADIAQAAPNVALASLYVLVGYQWLVAGGDKILYGKFPSQMGSLLQGQLTNSALPSAFRDLLRSVVLPHAEVFGVFIMSAETLAGLALLIAGVVGLLRPILARVTIGPLAALIGFGLRALGIVAPLAALGTLALGLNYWVLEGLPTPFFSPGLAYGGALHPSLILALSSVVLLVGQFAPHPRPAGTH